MFREYDGTMRALKMKRFESSRDFDERVWDKHRRDALALEQMTNSPYIINIYGYCVNSVIVDYSDKGSLYRVFRSEPSKEELLKVAHDVACAVRDANHFDNRERATIAHTDINPDQFLLVDGVYKLNDFNRAKFLSWDPERDEQCGFTFELNQGNVSADVLRALYGARDMLLNGAVHYQERFSHIFHCFSYLVASTRGV
jgi:serine/threonine protein kinase